MARQNNRRADHRENYAFHITFLLHQPYSTPWRPDMSLHREPASCQEPAVYWYGIFLCIFHIRVDSRPTSLSRCLDFTGFVHNRRRLRYGLEGGAERETLVISYRLRCFRIYGIKGPGGILALRGIFSRSMSSRMGSAHAIGFSDMLPLFSYKGLLCLVSIWDMHGGAS